MKRCTKTVSGKHIWIESKLYSQWTTVETVGGGTRPWPLFYKECGACGLTDDRPPRKGKKGKK